MVTELNITSLKVLLLFLGIVFNFSLENNSMVNRLRSVPLFSHYKPHILISYVLMWTIALGSPDFKYKYLEN